jgi:hypothetical protein
MVRAVVRVLDHHESALCVEAGRHDGYVVRTGRGPVIFRCGRHLLPDPIPLDHQEGTRLRTREGVVGHDAVALDRAGDGRVIDIFRERADRRRVATEHLLAAREVPGDVVPHPHGVKEASRAVEAGVATDALPVLQRPELMPAFDVEDAGGVDVDHRQEPPVVAPGERRGREGPTPEQIRAASRHRAERPAVGDDHAVEVRRRDK